ncbi:unnamed protein product, partial [Rotaria sp. Silwood1]
MVLVHKGFWNCIGLLEEARFEVRMQ